MIEIGIPDFGRLHLARLILDYNGSLAFDRRLLSGVADLLGLLAEHLQIHIITADTFGSVHRPLPAPTLQSMSCLRAMRKKAKPNMCDDWEACHRSASAMAATTGSYWERQGWELPCFNGRAQQYRRLLRRISSFRVLSMPWIYFCIRSILPPLHETVIL